MFGMENAKSSDIEQNLDFSDKSNYVVKSTAQDKFLETLIEKGGEILLENSKLSLEKHRLSVEKQIEFDKEELKIIEKLDTRYKFYKGLLISICIAALVLTAKFVPKPESVIPVLSLVIGLLFKSNSLSDFFARNKKNNEIEEI